MTTAVVKRSGRVRRSATHRTRSEDLRYANLLLDLLREAAGTAMVSEAEMRRLVYAVIEAGLIQQHRAPVARADFARLLSPALADLGAVPTATVEQARGLALLRTSLLRTGALSTASLADARGITPENARQWLSRHRRANRLFTVSHDGESLVPLLLLDEQLEPRPELAAAIDALRSAGEDGWALWAWFAAPSPWLDGGVPAHLAGTDADRVAEAARARAAASS